MCKQILLKVILVASLIILSHRILQAQNHLGVEAGATVSYLHTFQEPLMKNWTTPVVGARVGAFFEHEVKDFFAIKTGVFGTLKGSQITGGRWNLVYITVPALAIFTPVKPLKLGIGVELGALVSNNISLITTNTFNFGLRSEIAWQISPSFRLIAHGTLDLTPTFFVTYTDGDGNVLDNQGYNHITGGLSLAYTIKTFDKKN